MQEEKIYLYSRQDWKNDRKVTYPGGLIIDNVYDAGTGNLKKIVRQHDNMTIWEGIEYNKHGQLTFSIKGGIKQIMEYYPETGYLKSVTAPGMQSFGYHYDPLGNMDHRYDHLHEVNGQSLHEQFYYDRGNQLTGTYLNGTLASHIIYDNLGNITSKTATGGFEYQSGNSPYRLTAIVPDQNIDPGYKLSQIITYTDFNKVESITGNGYKLEIEYGLENQRISQSLSSVNQYGQTTLLLNKHFIGGLQEKIFYETGKEKTISYITSPEGLTAIEVKSGITSEWYTVFTDHLGSITTLLRESDRNRFELSYDAWGNRRDPATWVNYSGNLPDFITITDPAFITDRGFTGHEHLDMFGLINMNGRVYDPVVSRFLSPDSFIQTPELALNYNGYVYCLNNPLVYTDPDGEFYVIDSWIAGLFSGGWKEANKRAGNDIKIWGGLFASDPNKSFGGRVWETISRFTWQLPQTLGGFITSHSYNTFGLQGGVETVDYKYGATVLRTRNDGWGGVTQGSFIVGDNSIEADENNALFQHEYGHYIQSQSMGWAYYPRVGIPSIMSKGDHDFHAVEQDANRRAFLYFNKNIEGFQDDASLRDDKGWDFWSNSLNINGTNARLQYVDYSDPNQVNSLDVLRVRAKWYDHASWLLLPVGGPIWVGLINSGIYNR